MALLQRPPPRGQGGPGLGILGGRRSSFRMKCILFKWFLLLCLFVSLFQRLHVREEEEAETMIQRRKRRGDSGKSGVLMVPMEEEDDDMECEECSYGAWPDNDADWWGQEHQQEAEQQRQKNIQEKKRQSARLVRYWELERDDAKRNGNK